MNKISPLQAGDNAPAFSLQNQNDETITLSELLKQQQVLVYFYPRGVNTWLYRTSRKPTRPASRAGKI